MSGPTIDIAAIAKWYEIARQNRAERLQPKPAHPVHIVALDKTCNAVPAQWEGVTAPCPHCGVQQAVYIRYRGGMGRIGVGPTLDEAMDRHTFQWESDDMFDGCLEFDELLALLPDWITIAPDAESQPVPEWVEH